MSSPVYTIGDGTRTQVAMRQDGKWFERVRWRGVWHAWRQCASRPYEFSAYLVLPAQNARLPDVAI